MLAGRCSRSTLTSACTAWAERDSAATEPPAWRTQRFVRTAPMAPINNYQGLLTLEYHSPKWDWYGNGGIEYDGRTAFLNAKGAPVGYGALLFNNTGCGIETLPGTGFTRRLQPGRPVELQRRHQGHLGRHARLLVQALQRSEGQTAVRSAVLVPDQDGMGGYRHQAAGARREPIRPPSTTCSSLPSVTTCRKQIGWPVLRRPPEISF